MVFAAPPASTAGHEINVTAEPITQRYDVATTSKTDMDRATGTFMFEVDVPGFTARPYIFQVAARNNAGLGPRSEPSAMVFEACGSNEFLATHSVHNDPASAVCVECPVGAFCGGFPSQNVTALQGSWRVPWSTHGLMFEDCPEPSVCIGTPDDVDDILTLLGSPGSQSQDAQVDADRTARNASTARRL